MAVKALILSAVDIAQQQRTTRAIEKYITRRSDRLLGQNNQDHMAMYMSSPCLFPLSIRLPCPWIYACSLSHGFLDLGERNAAQRRSAQCSDRLFQGRSVISLNYSKHLHGTFVNDLCNSNGECLADV